MTERKHKFNMGEIGIMACSGHFLAKSFMNALPKSKSITDVIGRAGLRGGLFIAGFYISSIAVDSVHAAIDTGKKVIDEYGAMKATEGNEDEVKESETVEEEAVTNE